MSPVYKQLRNGDYGVTITWEHRTTGEVHTAHTPGEPRLEALRAALDGWNATEWRIRCISTPQTIYDDLIARRAITPTGSLEWGRNTEGGGDFDQLTRTPERYLLGKLGAMEYL